MDRTALLGAVLVLLVACGSPDAEASANTSPGEAAGTAVGSGPKASTIDGQFQLSFTVPQAHYAASDAISGTATLSVRDGRVARIWGSGGGPVAFSFIEVGGSRRIGPASSADCAPFTIRPDAPLTAAISKSGGWSADDLNAAFYETFLADPEIHLPAGSWDIGAQALFTEGQCGGRERNMSATVRVEIEP